MKRVQYLAGALGLAPLAAALMPAGNAVAATTTPKAAPSAKSASLHPVRGKVHPDGCAGSKEHAMSSSQGSPNFGGWFYWTPNGSSGFCIGAVEAQINTSPPTVQQVTVSVSGRHFSSHLSHFDYSYPTKDVPLNRVNPTRVGVNHHFGPAISVKVCLRISNFRGKVCGTGLTGTATPRQRGR
jgi:hypothetical protein